MSLLPSSSSNPSSSNPIPPLPPEPTPEQIARRKPLVAAFGGAYFIRDERWEQYPFERTHWAGAFNTYLAQRWYDGQGGIPWINPGPLAHNPEMLPLVRIARNSGVFDLHDPLTASYWQDYLNGHPVRRMIWERYEYDHGPQRALYWNNAQGQAWEATQGINAQGTGTSKGDA